MKVGRSILSFVVLLMVMTRILPDRPRVVLWLWERPEDLSSASGIAFAVLTGSFEIGDTGMRFLPRLQPVRLPDQAETIAVYRIDIQPGSSLPVDKTVENILRTLPRKVSTVQIDFDARMSERAAYRKLLELLRLRLTPDMRLSITALASWCADDPWIRDLPVDEAVPMLFQMGSDSPQVRRYLERGGTFRVPLCRTSAGLSLDEPILRLPSGLQRVYIFSSERWSPGSLARAQQAGVLH